MRKAQLIYIGGLSFSGSTVLDALLGRLPGVISLGEVHRLAMSARERHQSFGNKCSCGRLLHECSVWQVRLSRENLLASGLAGSWEAGWPISAYFGQPDTGLFSRLLDGAFALLPDSTLSKIPRRITPARRQIMAASASWRLFDAIAGGIAGNILVDSTKTPLRAKALSTVRPNDIHILWIKRDLRSVFASQIKHGLYGQTSNEQNLVLVAKKLATDARKYAFLFSKMNAIVVGHRDLCLDPAAQLRTITDSLGMTMGQGLDDSIEGGHLIPGNKGVWAGPHEIRKEFASLPLLTPEMQEVCSRWLSEANREFGYESERVD